MVTININIKNTIPVVKYHLIRFFQPKIPILSSMSWNLNAVPSLLSLFAICAIAIAVIGAIMITYKIYIKNHIPAHAIRGQIPVPPTVNHITAPETILTTRDGLDVYDRVATINIIKIAGIL